MCDFYKDVLQLEVLQADAKAARFKLADGTEAHVYSNEDTDHAYFGAGPVVGFAVESFSTTRAAMLQSGIEFLYPEPQCEDGRAWQHFRAPDGNIYEVIGPDDIDVINSEGGV
jgi:catechol 2,3-dioxygenase-like lactoylglutathione lyase family enzyme